MHEKHKNKLLSYFDIDQLVTENRENENSQVDIKTIKVFYLQNRMQNVFFIYIQLK